jgi:hypothetical protein
VSSSTAWTGPAAVLPLRRGTPYRLVTVAQEHRCYAPYELRSPFMAGKNKGGREVRKPKQPKKAKESPVGSSIVPPAKRPGK